MNKLAGSVHSELRCLLKHLTVRLEVFYHLSDADLRVPKEFVNWMDDTPAAREALKTLGVPWLKGRQPARKSQPTKRKKFECKFDKAWQGRCKKESFKPYCSEHRKLTCWQCGKQATHECDHATSLVCGAPLCGSHQHQHHF